MTHSTLCATELADAGHDCSCDYSRAVPEPLYPRMMRLRRSMVAMGNAVQRNGCSGGRCAAVQSGHGCDAVELWLRVTNEYDAVRDAWIAAGRPA